MQGNLRWDAVQRWPQTLTTNLDAYWLREGDVILAMDRPWIEAGLKYAAICAADLPSLLVQRVARLRGRGTLLTPYLRYVIGSREFTNHVLAVQTGTSVPHISPSQIREFTFALPPEDEQQRIVSVLGALDDKIELNRASNATLEEMARSLFRSWFVDFDPVHTKIAGRRQICVDEITAGLFAAELDDSILGRIPRGWRVVSLGEVLRLKRGYDLPTADRQSGTVPIVSSSGFRAYTTKRRFAGQES